MGFMTWVALGVGGYVLYRKVRGPFKYRERDGAWQAYFRGAPPSRNHVLHDERGYYVCWDRPIRTKEEAKKISHLWRKKCR
jgi:hypothetical protein